MTGLFSEDVSPYFRRDLRQLLPGRYKFCKDRLAAYKYPRQVEIVDEIPKTLTGKFLRRVLREKE